MLSREKCQFYPPSWFDTPSGSVLLLATDQYALFTSFLVNLALSLWGNVKKKKWQLY